MKNISFIAILYCIVMHTRNNSWLMNASEKRHNLQRKCCQ